MSGFNVGKIGVCTADTMVFRIWAVENMGWVISGCLAVDFLALSRTLNPGLGNFLWCSFHVELF